MNPSGESGVEIIHISREPTPWPQNMMAANEMMMRSGHRPENPSSKPLGSLWRFWFVDGPDVSPLHRFSRLMFRFSSLKLTFESESSSSSQQEKVGQDSPSEKWIHTIEIIGYGACVIQAGVIMMLPSLGIWSQCFATVMGDWFTIATGDKASLILAPQFLGGPRRPLECHLPQCKAIDRTPGPHLSRA